MTEIVEHRFFNKEFDCYSMSYHSIENGTNLDELESSDKIILPQSALEHLTHYDVANPIMMKITNSRLGLNRVIYCGVREFTSNQHTMYIPQWMMDHLYAESGQRVLVQSVKLPIATYIKIKPLTPLFKKLSNPRIVIEYHLQKFITLCKDEIITIKYCNHKFKIQIIDIKPAHAVCINNSDISMEIDDCTI